MLGAIRTKNDMVNLVFRRAVDALTALDFGEVDPLLEPAKTRRHSNAHSRWVLELHGVAHVEYLYRCGEMKKMAAQDAVAKAYGMSLEVVRKWERELRGTLGHLRVSREISFARNAASNAKEALRRAIKDEKAIDDLRYIEESYGRNALRRHGDEYKKIKGFGQPRS